MNRGVVWVPLGLAGLAGVLSGFGLTHLLGKALSGEPLGAVLGFPLAGLVGGALGWLVVRQVGGTMLVGASRDAPLVGAGAGAGRIKLTAMA